MKKGAFAILLVGALSQAQTLTQIIEGINQNGSLAAQKSLALRAETLKEAAKSAYYPKIEAAGTLYKKALVVPFEPKEARLAELRATYEIFDGFKRDDRAASLSYEAKSQNLKAEFTKESLIMEALSLFYAYFDAKADMEALEFRIKELDLNTKKFEVLTRNELATKDTLEAMNASKKEAEYQRESAKAYKEEVLARLEALSGLKLEALTWSPVSGSSARGVRKDIEAEKEGVKALSKAEGLHTYLPTLAAKASLKSGSYSAYDDMGGIQKQFARNAEAGIELSWTVFDYGMIKKEREAARLQTLSANQALLQKSEEVKAEVKAKEAALKAANAKLEAAKSALASTSIAYEYSKKRFAANLISYTDYLAELTKKESALSREKRAINESELSKARLLFAQGFTLQTNLR